MKQREEVVTQSPEAFYKKELLRLLFHYYFSEKKAKEWYNRPHKLLSDKGLSPKELLNSGKGKEVLKWVKLALDK